MNGNQNGDPNVSGNMPDLFDRMLGSFDGLPDVTKTKPSTIRAIAPLGVETQTFIVQTVRTETGDHVFVEAIAKGAVVRLVLPPAVSNTISRQRDALTTKARQKAAKQAAATRRELGLVPTFGRDRGIRPGRRKPKTEKASA